MVCVCVSQNSHSDFQFALHPQYKFAKDFNIILLAIENNKVNYYQFTYYLQIFCSWQ